jgi:hypothetical protein
MTAERTPWECVQCGGEIVPDDRVRIYRRNEGGKVDVFCSDLCALAHVAAKVAAAKRAAREAKP